MRSSPDEEQRHDDHDDLDDLYYVEQAIPATRAVGPETEHAIGAGADETPNRPLRAVHLGPPAEGHREQSHSLDWDSPSADAEPLSVQVDRQTPHAAHTPLPSPAGRSCPSSLPRRSTSPDSPPSSASSCIDTSLTSSATPAHATGISSSPHPPPSLMSPELPAPDHSRASMAPQRPATSSSSPAPAASSSSSSSRATRDVHRRGRPSSTSAAPILCLEATRTRSSPDMDLSAAPSSSTSTSSRAVRPSSSTAPHPPDSHTPLASTSRIPPPPPPALPSTNIHIPAPNTDYHLDEEDEDETELLMPDKILPLLRCPLCPFSTLLEAPITLHCGHTVCSKHVIRPHSTSTSSSSSLLSSILPSSSAPTSPGLVGLRCPLPTCTSRNATAQQAQIHPESGVNFRSASPQDVPMPMPSNARADSGSGSGAPRVDVTVNKILSLTTRTHRSLSLPEHGGSAGQSDDENEEEETAEHGELDSELQRFQYDAPLAGLSTMGASSSSSASNSTAATHRPRRHSRSRSRSRSLPPSPTLPTSSSHSSLPSPSPSQQPPRKRRRLPSSATSPPTSDTHSHDARDFASRHSRLPSAQERSTSRLLLSNRRAASALFEKELLSELTCEICFALMWQPVTTPCQHTFCSKCLLRSMDHSTACPLCRQELPGYVYAQDQPCNKVVLSIILKAFPAPYAERGSMIEAEERDTRLDTPIFVCQLSFPGMPTMLHLFEPRYRLMLRRCLASSNPCFGMIPPPRPTSSPASPGNDFGTMLRIKSVQMLPDGRSVVETWGTWRFRIMERGMLDGYVVARVERVEDQEESLYESDEANVEDIFSNAPRDPASGPESSAPGSSSHVSPASRSSVASQPIGLPTSFPTTTLLPLSSSNRVVRGRSNEELMNLCHEFLDQLKQGTPWVVQHLERTIVPMPTDPAQFSFWMALLLPIDEHEKAKLLPIRSPRLRLRLVVHWIEQLRSHWAHSYATASRWQVVLWWMCNFMMRFLFPRTARTRNQRTAVWLAWSAVVIAMVAAQVGLRREAVVESGSM